MTQEGNLLSGHRTALNGGTLADCHMVSLTPFTKDIANHSKMAVRRGYESALAKLLAIQHLNSGNASLVSELEGLDETCPVQFGMDFVNTQLNIGVATTHLARRMVNIDKPPCVFLGSTLSIVSATTARFTGSLGYPQISGASTSSFLDDANKYPLFSRTTPSTKANAKALAKYLHEEIGVRQLAVVYIADSYGHHYWEDLQTAVSEYNNHNNNHDNNNDNFELESVSLLPDLSNLPQAMECVKMSGYKHVFVAFYGEYLHDNSFMEEAVAQGIAGNDSNIQWILGDDFLPVVEDSSSSPLVDAYQHTSLFTADGSGLSTTKNPKYQEFTKQLNHLKDEAALSLDGDHSNPLKSYFETMVDDFKDREVAIEFLEKLLVDDTFLHPEFMSHEIPYEYESVIMAGLAICNTIEKNQLEENTPSSSLFVNGQGFQNELVNTIVDGISGTVILDPTTGTRLQDSTYYSLQTLIAQDFTDNGEPKTRFWKNKTAQVELTTIIDRDDETTNSRSEEHWVARDNYIHHNGGTSPPMIPDRTQSPPPSISSETKYPISMNENTFVRLIQGLSFALPVLASAGCILWTHRYRKQPIIRASKLLFLYLICCGVILVASATLPFSIMGTSGALETTTETSGGIIPQDFIATMTILCSASIWLRTLGFAVILSALFAKTYRFNKVICGAKLYRTSRARVLADYLIPLAVMLIMNILILSLMTALDPVTYGIIPNQNSPTDATLAYESCIFTKDQRHKFWIPLIGWNMSVLVFALHQSSSVRNCEFVEANSRFPSEGPQIFNALLCCLLVTLMGFMIMLVVRDRGDGMTVALVEATIAFVFCILVLLSIFATKMKHVWRTTSRPQDTTDTDCSHRQNHRMSLNGKISIHQDESESDPPKEENHHPSFSAHSRTKEELKVENDGLRKRNLELEEELLLYPTFGKSKNTILTNFFGRMLGADEDDFEDEYSHTQSVAISTEQQQQQQNEDEKEEEAIESTPALASTFRKAPPTGFRPKKILEDIFFSSSDVIPSYSSDIRPISISAETTSWSLSREFQTLKSYLKNSSTTTSTSNNSKRYYYSSSTIYKTTTTDTTNNKSSPETKSTPTTDSDLQPHRSSFYKSPRQRGPEPEDHSNSPPNMGSFGSSMVPLGGSPPTPIGKHSYSQGGLAIRDSPPETISSRPTTRNPFRSSFDSSTAPVGNHKPRSVLRSSFDSSMVPLGDPSLPGASLSTGMMEPRSIFRPKRGSGGLDPSSIPEDDDDDPTGGIPSHIIICRRFDTKGSLGRPSSPVPSVGQSSASPSTVGRAPRRPSLGEDVEIPKDPRHRFRHVV